MILILAVLIQAIATAGGPVASIRVVGPSWQPLPGAELELVPVNGCAEARPRGPSERGFANDDGVVEFKVTTGFHVVRAQHSGGFERQEQCMDFGSGMLPSARMYVQIRLRFDPTQAVWLSEPALKSTTVPNSSLVLLDFVGVYRDSVGAYYEVAYMEGGLGLELALPDGRSLFFSERNGTTFTGRAGRLAFRLARNRVTGFSFMPAAVAAKRSDNPQ